MSPTIDHLCHYPVKGLSAQRLSVVTLEAGKGFPFDRVFGLARHDSGFDPENPKPLPKGKFVVLARDAALATLETHYDDDAQTLTITHRGETHAFDVTDPMARDVMTDLIATHVGLHRDQQPSLQSAGPHRFTDVSVVSPEMMNAVSLINMDSVAAFSKDLGQVIDPARFRGNIMMRGLPAWQEFDFMDRHLHIGDVTLKVVQRTRRCPATEVNLETGERDINVPGELNKRYDHSDMGVYAHVISGGTIRPGDKVSIGD